MFRQVWRYEYIKGSIRLGPSGQNSNRKDLQGEPVECHKLIERTSMTNCAKVMAYEARPSINFLQPEQLLSRF
jgi:hypothetical protein